MPLPQHAAGRRAAPQLGDGTQASAPGTGHSVLLAFCTRRTLGSALSGAACGRNLPGKPGEAGTVIILVLWMGKLRHGAAMKLVLGHSASEQQSWGLNSAAWLQSPAPPSDGCRPLIFSASPVCRGSWPSPPPTAASRPSADGTEGCAVLVFHFGNGGEGMWEG